MTPASPDTITPELVRLAGSRDREAAIRARDALVRAWHPEVLRWCRLLCDARVHPDDVAQEVLLVLSRRGHCVEAPERLRPWLWGVTWRTVSAHRRSAWIRRWARSTRWAASSRSVCACRRGLLTSGSTCRPVRGARGGSWSRPHLSCAPTATVRNPSKWRGHGERRQRPRLTTGIALFALLCHNLQQSVPTLVHLPGP